MLPLISYNLLEQINLLSNAVKNFEDKFVKGLKADQKRIESMNEMSLALATALVPIIGYDQAARIAKKSHETGKTVRQIALEENILPEEQLNKILDLGNMIKPED